MSTTPESNTDIRWQQRFANFNKALSQLANAVDLLNQRELSLLEAQGLIQAFEFTHELAWNVMKDYAEFQGYTEISGSRDAVRLAFKMELIHNGDAWMDMLKSRNQSTHTYNESTVKHIMNRIVTSYFPLFKQFQHKMDALNDKKHCN